ncbi:MAG: FAD-dependent monooxygenase [Paracoccus sp. (in: a-proteobacteria)]|uniref:FAD-dependent monooxygenase n=1 Tax=Paracoccus sp. TaxID=267 RepID=UPI0026DF4294|nr:FAD-dependent monooxygenase [Paracoccus sp. (in: a-proteobacteria)]MDO5633067.1 FAD-dependent monooxygenase [Paracoccus sp. (in: a-proteobacteria)]
MSFDADLIVLGAGPVGMCAAIEAGRRGRQVIVLERREETDPAGAKCNTVAARTMEVFRSFGISGQVAAAGLPDDFPTDVVTATSVTGPELDRLRLPSRRERASGGFADSDWPSPEPMVRLSQIYLEPVLKHALLTTAGVTAYFRANATAIAQDATGVTVTATMPDGTERRFRAQYLIGADGARSLTRHQIGAKLTGDAEIARSRSSLIRAPGLRALWGDRRPGWMSWIVNHEVKGILVAIDGQDIWLAHRALPQGETDFGMIDPDRSIRAMLGVGGDFAYEVLHHEDWIARRMVADRLRDGRIFIAGDAAHLWVPFAGYGMNAGIADAMNAVWTICNMLEGWAGPAMLDAYQAERHPITEQVSHHAMQAMLDMVDQLGKGPVPRALSSRLNPLGAAMRLVMGQRIAPINRAQFLPIGLNFGYYYRASTIIAADGTPPAYTMTDYQPSTVPGCRLPHFAVSGRPVIDLIGPVYTLICLDPAVDITPLTRAAGRVGMPLTLVNAPRPDLPCFTHPLLIVRRDQHIAWRGTTAPQDADALIAHLSGHIPED